MNNMVKLVQASGKGLLVPADAIQQGILRSLEPCEKAHHDKGETFLWLILNGQAQSAIVRERLGFILNKAGGASSERVVLDGMAGTRISMPRTAFAHAIEGERIVDSKGEIIPSDKIAAAKKAGTAVEEDATTVFTHLRGASGTVAFYARNSVADLYDLINAEASDDDGSVEYDDEGKPIDQAKDAPVKPTKRAKAA